MELKFKVAENGNSLADMQCLYMQYLANIEDLYCLLHCVCSTDPGETQQYPKIPSATYCISKFCDTECDC